MKLLMISGDRSLLRGTHGPFLEMLTEFARHWERIDIITPCVPDAQMELVTLPVNVGLHPSPYGLLRQSQWIRRKGKELLSLHGHQVMTVHEYPPFYNGLGAYLLKRDTGVHYALEIHHVVGEPVAASFKEFFGRILSRGVLAFDAAPASAVRVVSRSVYDVLLGFGLPEDKLRVVPSFYLDHQSLAKIHAPAQKQVDLVTAARLVPNKGIDRLLTGLASVPGVTLQIIGDGPQRQALEALTDTLGLRPRVTFTGWLPTPQDVWFAIASARLFVLSSLSEGGPRSALEAMALGVPVLATRVGVMPEVIQDGQNGFFTTGTADDIGMKVGEVLFGSLNLSSVGERGKQSVARFDRTTLIRDYAQFLQSLA